MILAAPDGPSCRRQASVLTMNRKVRKGYFVAGQFIAEGSELDLQLRMERQGDGPSRAQLKRESDELQALGTDLLGLRADARAALNLPEKLQEALVEAARISDFEGRRRQMQFIGKLMRKLDEPALAAIRDTLASERRGPAQQTRLLHDAEQWRDRLLADEAATAEWLARFPLTDAQQLRSQIRQARKDARPERPGEAPRHARAYRDLFQTLRTQLAQPDPASEPSEP
jgi:ribosome-associated protein